MESQSQCGMPHNVKLWKYVGTFCNYFHLFECLMSIIVQRYKNNSYFLMFGWFDDEHHKSILDFHNISKGFERKTNCKFIISINIRLRRHQYHAYMALVR